MYAGLFKPEEVIKSDGIELSRELDANDTWKMAVAKQQLSQKFVVIAPVNLFDEKSTIKKAPWEVPPIGVILMGTKGPEGKEPLSALLFTRKTRLARLM